MKRILPVIKMIWVVSSVFCVFMVMNLAKASANSYVAISAGNTHCLAINEDGTVWAWGANNHGQLGDGTHWDSNTPVKVKNLTNVIAVSASYGSTVDYSFSLALKSDGTVWAWGFNGFGQLGDGTYPYSSPWNTTYNINGTPYDSDTPVQVKDLSDIVAISAGLHHSLALTSDGSVYGWGENWSGQIHDCDVPSAWDYYNVPVQIETLSGVVAIDATIPDKSVFLNGNGGVGGISLEDVSCDIIATFGYHCEFPFISDVIAISAFDSGYVTVLKGDGTVYDITKSCASDFDPPPVAGDEIDFEGTITQIEISDAIAVSDQSALKLDGTVWSWGNNTYGQLGNGTNTDSDTPVQAIGLTEVIAISKKGSVSLALKSDGTVWSWGRNNYGQLGDGTNNDSNVPVQVVEPTIESITPLDIDISKGAVSCGSSCSLVLKSDGTVWGWGNKFYILGESGVTNTPIQTKKLEDVVAISAGFRHALALMSNGSVKIWGELVNSHNTYDLITVPNGKRDIGSYENKVIAIAAGEIYSLVLLQDGTVWGWGSNNNGQLGNGTRDFSDTPVQAIGLNDVIAISAGNLNIALKSDGTVWKWGFYSGDGSIISIPEQFTEFNNDNIAISTSYSNSLVIKVDGTVWEWYSGTPTIVVQKTELNDDNIALSAGQNHSLALKSDGTVWAWSRSTDRYLLGNIISSGIGVPAQVSGLSNVIAISAGYNSTSVITTDCSVYSWGYNNNGLLGDGTFENSIPPVKSLIEVCDPNEGYDPLTVVATINESEEIALEESQTQSQNSMAFVSNKTLANAGNGVAGIEVDFSVVSGPNEGTQNTDTTDAEGKAYFTYTSNKDGIDVIEASFINSNGQRVASNQITKEWGTSTSITLLSFRAEAENDNVNLTWETATEPDNAGFHLYRAESENGSYTKINDELIESRGGAVYGANYNYWDILGYSGMFYYKLEDIDYNGNSVMHGPIKVMVRETE